MTADELRKMLADEGISHNGAAVFLSVTTRTIRNWLSGKGKIPDMAEYALRWAIAEMRKRGVK
jgi:DNA-binding transcriptional regulator YiaG